MKQKNLCRLCGEPLKYTFLDLGISPLANSYVNSDKLQQSETMYPLKTFVCDSCYLVQVEDYESPDHILSDYAYFSSYSESWLAHCKSYVDEMISRFGFKREHQVVEIASNDGYLLQYFSEKEVPVLGIEPAANVAAVAKERGIPTTVDFFGTKLALKLREQGKSADLLLGNNVLAHVPELNDFVSGMKILLKPTGVITMEFPHLKQLIEQVQFDTIYHEHYSYFSFTTVCELFSKHGLKVFDVDKLPTHGGSLHIYAQHEEYLDREVTSSVQHLLQEELSYGMKDLDLYQTYKDKAMRLKRDIVRLCIDIRNEGKTIAGYGAPAKGNTLLNYCGLDKDYLNFTVDLSPHKQNKYLPGSRVPIYAPDKIKEEMPDYLLILPWNLKDEIIRQTEYIREWGGKWIVPVPHVSIIN